MSKIKITNNAFIYPMPMVLAGALVEGRPNFLAVGWVARVNYQPPLIAIALGKPHYTNAGIHHNKAFSVNVPGITLLQKVDLCGIVSGSRFDKAGLFDVFHGDTAGAPMIKECPVCMACKLTQVVSLPSNELFIGEIVEAYADEAILTDDRPDITKIQPFTLTMPDNNYWKVGERAGGAWSSGESLLKAASAR